jgi:hypothetical protein
MHHPAMTDLNVEQALKRLEDRATMLRFFADTAASVDPPAPDPSVFSGLGDLCADIQHCAQVVRRALVVTRSG